MDWQPTGGHLCVEKKRIIIYSDNTITMAAINKASSRNSRIMKYLRSLFWLSAFYNFHLTARYLPGTLNIVADRAFRLHLPGYLQSLLPFSNGTPLTYHMSSDYFTFLLGRFQSWSSQWAGLDQSTRPSRTEQPPI